MIILAIRRLLSYQERGIQPSGRRTNPKIDEQVVVKGSASGVLETVA
jgi:hypothetical protein